HSHPLSRWRSLCLLAQHPQTIREGRNAVPTQLQIEVEAAAYQVKVRVIQPWNYGALAQVNQFRPLVTEAHYFPIASDCEEFPVTNRERLDYRAAIILCRNLTVVKNQVRGLFIHCLLRSYLCAGAGWGTSYSGKSVGGAPGTMVEACSAPTP